MALEGLGVQPGYCPLNSVCNPARPKAQAANQKLDARWRTKVDHRLSLGLGRSPTETVLSACHVALIADCTNLNFSHSR